MYTEEFKANVVKDIIEGMPIKAVARVYNIERHTVQRWFRQVTGGPTVINSNSLKYQKVGIKVDVVPKEITNLHCYIYIDECVYDSLTK